MAVGPLLVQAMAVNIAYSNHFSPKSREQRINQVSRHRAVVPAPKTPERYWDVRFPSMEEQRKLGLHHETDSPLFKQNQQAKKKLF